MVVVLALRYDRKKGKNVKKNTYLVQKRSPEVVWSVSAER